jgi:hypothetical protein
MLTGKFFYIVNGMQQVGFATPTGFNTSSDIGLVSGTKIWGSLGASNYAFFDLFNASSGNTTFKNLLNSGHFQSYVSGGTTGSSILALDIAPSGITALNYGVTMPYGSAYYEQANSTTNFGRLQLFDVSGNTNFRNSFNTGLYKIFMSNGASTGATTQMFQMQPNGNAIFGNNATFTDNGYGLSELVSGTNGYFKAGDFFVNSSGKLGISTAPATSSLGAYSLLTRNTSTGNIELTTAITPLRLTGSGTGSATTISIPHGLTGVTSASIVTVSPINSASSGYSYVTADATNINIVYTTAPVSGSSNLSYNVFIKP